MRDRGAAVAVRLSAGLILATLLGLAALAWLWNIRQPKNMVMGLLPLAQSGDTPASDPDGMTNVVSGAMSRGEMSALTLPLFLGMWVTMMVAMMFPSVAPMVIAFSRISRARNRSRFAVPAFVIGYLVAWSVAGLAAYALYRLLLHVAPSLSLPQALLAGGTVLALAGIYQLSPGKYACLRHCRSTPLDFLVHWRPRLRGAVEMGVAHGAYCVGCCWALMVVLLVVGLADLAWMALAAALIFVEKLTRFGHGAAKLTGAIFIVLGTSIASGAAITLAAS